MIHKEITDNAISFTVVCWLLIAAIVRWIEEINREIQCLYLGCGSNRIWLLRVSLQ